METKLEEDIKSRINRIETTLHEVIEANTEYLLEEKRDGGKMKLEVISDNQCLVIKNMEKHRLGIFQNKKCADHIVFEYIGDRKWNVHIIEMKKAVTNQKWDGIKKQFEGALINTLALNGYFENTNIEKIYTYTAFQRDKINALENTNPIEFRARTGEKLPDRSNWNKKVIEILDRKVTHVKIPMKLDGDISVESIKI